MNGGKPATASRATATHAVATPACNPDNTASRLCHDVAQAEESLALSPALAARAGLSHLTLIYNSFPQPRAAVLLAHGAGAGMRHPFMQQVAADLAAIGVAIVRFQFPYMEKASKRPDPAALCEAVIAEVWTAVIARWPHLPWFAGGKSMGGRMVSHCAARGALPHLRGLLFWGFPLHPAGAPSVQRAAHLPKVAVPMLFLQGTRDALCEAAQLQASIAPLPHATIHMIADADHAFAVRKKSGRDAHAVFAELQALVSDFVAAQIA